MPSFAATTSVAAPARHVWETLLHTEQWPAWDARLECVEGELAANGRLTLQVRDVSRPFRLRVTTWEPGRRVVLASGMPLGLFTGTRTYRMTPDGDQTTTFAMSEQYTGPLAAVIGKSIPDLQPSFDAFVSGLRAAAER